MSIENLSEEYQENYTMQALVFQFMKRRYQFFSFSYKCLLVLSGLFVLTLPSFFFGLKILQIVSIAYVIVLIVTVVSAAWFEHSAKKIITERYGIQPTNRGWRPKALDDLQQQKIIQFLKNNTLYTPKNLDMLVAHIKEFTEKRKNPPLWDKTGKFSSIILTLIAAYIGYLFSKVSGWDLTDVSIAIFGVIVVLVLLGLFIGVAKRVLFFNQDIFIPNNPNIVRAELLEHVQALQLICKEQE